MTQFRKYLISFFSLLILLQSAFAYSADSPNINNVWTVNSIKGSLHSKKPSVDTWSEVSEGARLNAPVFLKSGDNSRIKLLHREDETIIGSNTVIELREEKIEKNEIFSRIIQSIGYALFKIEKSAQRTVEVSSPYLVSVVKGTTFSVQVTNSRAVVNLVDGLLQINAVGISDDVLLKSGQIALLAEGDKKITVISPAETTGTDEDSSMNTAPINITNVIQSTNTPIPSKQRVTSTKPAPLPMNPPTPAGPAEARPTEPAATTKPSPTPANPVTPVGPPAATPANPVTPVGPPEATPANPVTPVDPPPAPENPAVPKELAPKDKPKSNQGIGKGVGGETGAVK